MTYGLRVCAGLSQGIHFQWFSVLAGKVGAGSDSMILRKINAGAGFGSKITPQTGVQEID